VPPVLMMVTDRARVGHAPGVSDVDALVEAASQAARAGLTMIQVRERGLDDRVLLDLTARIVRQSAPLGVRVVVNDRVDVALASGAAGVHLPAAGVAPARVRPIAPAGFLIGRSVHSAAEAVEAERTGACDYLVFGSVFESASKPVGHEPAGIEALTRVCRAVRLPVLAIGGIVVERAREIARAGASGIAAISLFLGRDENGLRTMVRDVTSAFAAE
jgi:thiamine-phosphate pyrophosphorylase